MKKLNECTIEEKEILKTLEALYAILRTPTRMPSYSIQQKVGLAFKYWMKLTRAGVIRNDSKASAKPVYVWDSIKPNIYMAIETLKDYPNFENSDNPKLIDPSVEKRYLTKEVKTILWGKLIVSMAEENLDDIKTGEILKINPAYFRMTRNSFDHCPLAMWTRLRLWHDSGLTIRKFSSEMSHDSPYIGEGFAVRVNKKSDNKKLIEEQETLGTEPYVHLRDQKPPMGLRPKFLADEERIAEINEAIFRYMGAKKIIPQEWIDEYNSIASSYLGKELVAPIQNLKTERNKYIENATSYIENATSVLAKREIKNFNEEVNIADIADLSTRCYNALRMLDCKTLGDLTKFKRSDLLIFHNVGKTTVDEIENILKKFGLKLSTSMQKSPISKSPLLTPVAQRDYTRVLAKEISDHLKWIENG